MYEYEQNYAIYIYIHGYTIYITLPSFFKSVAVICHRIDCTVQNKL